MIADFFMKLLQVNQFEDFQDIVLGMVWALIMYRRVLTENLLQNR